MMKKRDWIIIAAVLLGAIIWLLVTRSAPQEPAYVTVYVHDAVYARVHVSEHQTIEVKQDDHTRNVVLIDEAGIRMESSTCDNQLCVNQGVIDPKRMHELPLGNWIVCLPNAVTIEISDTEPLE